MLELHHGARRKKRLRTLFPGKRIKARRRDRDQFVARPDPIVERTKLFRTAFRLVDLPGDVVMCPTSSYWRRSKPWPRDFTDRPKFPKLKRIDQKIARQDQAMQRVKHADRRMETRNKIVLGGLVIKAGAGDLPEEELVAVLSGYMTRRAQGITADDSDSQEPQPE